MSKDDYFYIVYKILKYLYKQLKCGNTVVYDEDFINALELERIDVTYWEYIIKSLFDEQYVQGDMIERHYIDSDVPTLEIETLQITPKGIEYLQENSNMKKVAEFLKDATNIITSII